MTNPIKVPVSLLDRSYDIVIGTDLLSKAGQLIGDAVTARHVAIVSDENVAAQHLKVLEKALHDADIKTTTIIIPPGEKSKSFDCLQIVVDKLLAARLERSDYVIALGGGVVGDLTGFAAAIVRRGMGFIQIPTSLLAQVDSSVGGKTGINTNRGKNLVGAFYQPALVLADTQILETLPIREFRAGYAEVVKYGLINQSAFFSWLENNWQQVFAKGPACIEAIATACRSKADIVARDERESGERALLNLGHTFGHALEAAVAYNSERLVHGEAVAIGMVLAFEFSAHLKLLPEADVDRVISHLKQVGLPTTIQYIPGDIGDAKQLMHYIQQDKKVSQGQLTFILARGIGKSFIAKDIDPNAVETFLQKKLSLGN